MGISTARAVHSEEFGYHNITLDRDDGGFKTFLSTERRTRSETVPVS